MKVKVCNYIIISKDERKKLKDTKFTRLNGVSFPRSRSYIENQSDLLS